MLSIADSAHVEGGWPCCEARVTTPPSPDPLPSGLQLSTLKLPDRNLFFDEAMAVVSSKPLDCRQIDYVILLRGLMVMSGSVADISTMKRDVVSDEDLYICHSCLVTYYTALSYHLHTFALL